MFLGIDRLQIELRQPAKVDPNSATALQELVGGIFGEMSTLNNYFLQSIRTANWSWCAVIPMVGRFQISRAFSAPSPLITRRRRSSKSLANSTRYSNHHDEAAAPGESTWDFGRWLQASIQ
jgi:Manganese containing catalase